MTTQHEYYTSIPCMLNLSNLSWYESVPHSKSCEACQCCHRMEKSTACVDQPSIFLQVNGLQCCCSIQYTLTSASLLAILNLFLKLECSSLFKMVKCFTTIAIVSPCFLFWNFHYSIIQFNEVMFQHNLFMKYSYFPQQCYAQLDNLGFNALCEVLQLAKLPLPAGIQFKVRPVSKCMKDRQRVWVNGHLW